MSLRAHGQRFQTCYPSATTGSTRWQETPPLSIFRLIHNFVRRSSHLHLTMGPGSILSGIELSHVAAWNWFADNYSFLGPILIWLFGAVFGFLLAGLFGTFSRSAVIFRYSPPGAGVRRAALLLHGFVLVRDLWHTQVERGTLRRFLWNFGSYWYKKLVGLSSEEEPLTGKGVAEISASRSSWPVTEEDLEFFKSRGAVESKAFKKIIDRDLEDSMKYSAMFRVLPGNKTEYKSITIARNCTAQEMTDFYLDDHYRTKWDGLITEHKVLENGSLEDRCQVVHWIRSFPVPCLSDREYVIARRVFTEGDTIYTISKSCEHLEAPRRDEIVRMDEFYSMWSCRTIECPWGSNQPACEVILFHHEQFKIPERIARFAACKGMWGFVKGMGPFKEQFVEERRKSCQPDDLDPEPYGYDISKSKEVQPENAASPQKNHRLKRVKQSALAAGATLLFMIFKGK